MTTKMLYQDLPYISRELKGKWLEKAKIQSYKIVDMLRFTNCNMVIRLDVQYSPNFERVDSVGSRRQLTATLGMTYKLNHYHASGMTFNLNHQLADTQFFRIRAGLLIKTI